jgi:hypothetical protein
VVFEERPVDRQPQVIRDDRSGIELGVGGDSVGQPVEIGPTIAGLILGRRIGLGRPAGRQVGAKGVRPAK